MNYSNRLILAAAALGEKKPEQAIGSLCGCLNLALQQLSPERAEFLVAQLEAYAISKVKS